jgi:hypothetical protein
MRIVKIEHDFPVGGAAFTSARRCFLKFQGEFGGGTDRFFRSRKRWRMEPREAFVRDGAVAIESGFQRAPRQWAVGGVALEWKGDGKFGRFARFLGMTESVAPINAVVNHPRFDLLALFVVGKLPRHIAVK